MLSCLILSSAALLWPGATAASLYAQRPAQAGTAQSSGTITGTVVDSTGGEPLRSVSVAVLRPQSTQPISGAITGADGGFAVQGLSPGTWRIRVSSIGYQPRYIENIALKPGALTAALGTIKLQKADVKTQEVTVEARREVIETSIDKRVYNIGQDISVAGGTAVDALQNVPSVTVDADRNIQLRGSSGVVVLIDGKPSALVGSSRQAVLEQIAATDIERVEVLNNPGAKYDPEGVSGIINIVLKRERAGGLNGTVSLGAGTRDKYTGSASLNWRDGDWTVFGSYTGQYNDYFNRGKAFQRNSSSADVFFLDQSNDGYRRTPMHGGRVGMEWSPSQTHTLSLSSSLNFNGGREYSSIRYLFLDAAQQATGNSLRTADEDRNDLSGDIDATWKMSLGKPRHEWVTSARWSFSDRRRTIDAASAGTAQVVRPVQQTDNDEAFGVVTIQSDYSEPTDLGFLETGAKVTLRNIDSDFRALQAPAIGQPLVNDSGLTNRFLYDEQVYAAYASLSTAFDNFGITAGLRYEYTAYSIDQRTTNQRQNFNYGALFPSATVKYKFSPAEEIALSYSRRINRPSTNSLNPFPSFEDPYNLRTGNPALLPEYTHSFDLSFLYFAEGFSLSPSLYYRSTSDGINRFRYIDSNGVSVTTFNNFAAEDNLGLELIAQATIAPWWRLNGNTNIFYRSLDVGNLQQGLNRTGTAVSGRLMNVFKLTDALEFQLSYFLWWPGVLAQGTMDPMHGADIAMRYEIAKGMDLSFRLSDVFDTRQFAINTNGANFTAYNERKRETQVGFLTFSWRFGIQDQSANKRGRRDRQDGGGDAMDDGF